MLHDQFYKLVKKAESFSEIKKYLAQNILKYLFLLLSTQYHVTAFAYVLGFQWLINYTNKYSKSTRKLKAKMRFLVGDDEKKKDEINNNLTYTVSPYTFWAIPFNWIFINIADLIAGIIVLAAAAVQAPLQLLEHISRSLYNSIRTFIINTQISNLLKRHQDKISDLATHHFSTPSEPFKQKMFVKHVSLDTLLKTSADKVGLQWKIGSIIDYIKHRNKALQKKMDSLGNYHLLSGFLIFPLFFIIPYGKILEKRIATESERLIKINKNLARIPNALLTSKVYVKLINVFAEYDLSKEHHGLIEKCTQKHGASHILPIVKWGHSQSTTLANVFITQALKLLNSVESKNIEFVYFLLKSIDKNPETKKLYDAPSLISLTGDMVKKIGVDKFKSLLEIVLNDNHLKPHYAAILNYAMGFGTAHIDKYLRILTQENTWDILKTNIIEELQTLHFNAFPEVSLEETLARYTAVDVEFPLSSFEIATMRRQYTIIQALSDEYATYTIEELEQKRLSVVKKLNEDANDESARLQLLAIMRQHVKQIFGVFPYNIQMLNVLAFMNMPNPMRVAQIKTGEGKSITTALLSAFYASLGHRIDVHTTFRDLAVRDAIKFKPFYESLGLTVGDVCEQYPREQHFDPNIVYGTTHNFEFAHLFELTTPGRVFRGKRPYDMVVIEEVDSMFLDGQLDKAYIATQPKNAELYDPKVYSHLWTLFNEKPDAKLSEIKEFLKPHFPKLEFPDELLRKWRRSAKTAKTHEEGKHYIIKETDGKKKIHIVDFESTGEVYESRHWQNGIHNFIEVKHGLPVTQETFTGCGINHIEFFRKYNSIIGLTGTIGTAAERNELKHIYRVDTFDSPPYKPSQKRAVPHIVARDQAEKIKAIIQVVEEKVNNGQPVLILCETIAYSQKIETALKEKFTKEQRTSLIQIYNGIQISSSDEIIVLAGTASTTTVATNTASRGADAVPTDESEDNGGLHVITTFKAVNKRVEEQGFGRTGRQGRKGTYQYILCEEEFSEYAEEKLETQELIARWQTDREINNAKISEMHLRSLEINHLEYVFQCIFFSLGKTNISADLYSKWAEFYSDLLTKVNTITQVLAISENNDDIHGYELFLWGKFKSFWQENDLTKLFKATNIFKLPKSDIEQSNLSFSRLMISLAFEDIQYLDNLNETAINILYSLCYKTDLLNKPTHSSLSLFAPPDFSEVIPKLLASLAFNKYDLFKRELDIIHDPVKINLLINQLQAKINHSVLKDFIAEYNSAHLAQSFDTTLAATN